MHRYEKVYRFLAEDMESFDETIGEFSNVDDIDFSIRMVL